MPAVMEAIDRMTSDERVKTMEYLWAVMTAVAAPEPPAWHGDVLAERRRRVQSGEEEFLTIAESKRRLLFTCFRGRPRGARRSGGGK